MKNGYLRLIVGLFSLTLVFRVCTGGNQSGESPETYDVLVLGEAPDNETLRATLWENGSKKIHPQIFDENGYIIIILLFPRGSRCASHDFSLLW